MFTARHLGARCHDLYLPEVTFLSFRLECNGNTGHAVRMNSRISTLFSPLNLAGIMVWIAIGWDLANGQGGTPIWLSAPVHSYLLLGLHGLFLVLFLWLKKTRLLVIGQLVVALALMLLTRNFSLPILFIIVVAQIAQLWPTRSTIILFIAINVMIYLVYAFIWKSGAPAIMTLMSMSFQAFAAITSWYAVSAERARDALAAINAELLGTRSLLDASVRDSERLRISRELHDVAGHKLTALKLNLKALQREPNIAASPQLQIAADLSDELLQDIRAVVQQLRLHDGPPLREALQALAAPFPQLTLDLKFNDLDTSLTIIEAEAILRCVQEALTNAIKHADAKHLFVSLTRNDSLWNLRIHDDGKILPRTHQGNGLNGMRERIESLGGQLQLQAIPSMPLTAQWPVRE
jgi:signal transduction histidine kinase